MSAADPEHVAFAGPAQSLFDVADTVDGVTGNPLERYRRGDRARDHSRRKLWLGRKADIGRHVGRFQAIRIVGPFLRKIQRTIDEGMTVARNVGGEHADLAVRDLARRTGVLTRHSARRLALLEKAGLVDHQHRIVIRQMLDDIVAHDVAQRIGIPTPRPRIACCRHGPGSPAASARIQPVLRRSSPSRPSRNRPAFVATRSCVNNGRIRFLISRSDDAHNSSVSSIDAARVHDLRIMVAHGFRTSRKATVMLASGPLGAWQAVACPLSV